MPEARRVSSTGACPSSRSCLILKQMHFSIKHVSKAATKTWQVRRAENENSMADDLAAKHTVSKNDVIRRGLRLLAIVDKLAEDGRILLVQRRGRKEKAVEVWLI